MESSSFPLVAPRHYVDQMLDVISSYQHSAFNLQNESSHCQQQSPPSSYHYAQAYYCSPPSQHDPPTALSPDSSTTASSQGSSPDSTQLPTNPATQPEPSSVPLTVSITMLNLRFMKSLQTKAKCQVQELQSFYCLKSAEVESARLTALRSATVNTWVTKSISAYYDQQHNCLIDQVESRLSSLETNQPQVKQLQHSSTTTTDSQTSANSGQSKSISSVALRIMTNWYNNNSEHPYPSYDTCEVMSKAGNITVDQVKKWFANRRLRLGQTKTIQVIAKRRKRSRTVSQDDIFFTGGSSSD